MSANRSVQAAQRRRAGPTTNEPNIPGRSPQPSINSAQMFANQARPGQGPNIPSGRLAGQQVAMQQQQQQKQQIKQSSTSKEGLSSINKMTIAQAITLITLRLGTVETKLNNVESFPQTQTVSMDGQDMVLIDQNVIESITSRLESLEKRSSTSSGTDVNLLKQQFETVKQALVQTKGATTTIVKDNKDLKIQVANFKNELSETKELLNALQNEMKEIKELLKFSTNIGNTFNEEYDNEGYNSTYDDEQLNDNNNYTNELEQEQEQEEIVGTNLKELIENEMNEQI